MLCELHLAGDAWRDCQWERALALYLRLLREFLADSARVSSEWTADQHRALERTAYLATLFAQVEEADLLLSGCAELSRKQGLTLQADRATLQRVQLALGSGRIAQANEILDTMRPTLGNVFDETTFETTEAGLIRWEQARKWDGPGDRRSLFAQFYLDMGRLAEFHGDFGLASRVVRRGLHHANREFSGDAGNFAAPLRLTLAELLIESGDLRSASGHLALANLMITESDEPGHAVRLKELWAAIHLLAGEFGASIDQLRYVLVFLQGQGLRRAALGAQLNLAYAQIFLLQTVEAQKSLDIVVEEARLHGETDLRRRASQLMALAEWRLGRLVPVRATSVRFMREANPPPASSARIWRSPPVAPSGTFLARFDERATVFRAYLESGEVSGAEREWVEIDRVFGSSDSELMRIRLRSLEGEFLALRGQPGRAAAMIRHNLSPIRACGLKAELSVTLAVAAEYETAAGRTDEAEALIVESRSLSDEMAQSLPGPERLMFLLGQTAVEEDWLRTQIERLAGSSHAAGTDALWDEVERILERIEAQKELLIREVLGRNIALGSRRDRRLECPLNRAVVTFVVLPDRVLTVCYTCGDFRFCIRPLGRLRIRECVSRWHVSDGSLEDGLPARPDAAEALAAAMGLRELVRGLPAGVDDLVFIPDDSLNGFPFAALRDEHGYLIERYAISVAHGRPRSPVPGSVSRPLVAGVMFGTPKFPILSKVNELGWLASYFPGACPLAAADVSRQNLLRSLPAADLFHVVCHGDFSSGHPEATGLVPVPRPGKAELVSLTDIAALSLGELQHATLTACWGADNYVLPGRWTLGIAEVFCWAGTRSVLASLWKSHTLVADRFIRTFYGHLDHAVRNEALRLTQLEFLRRGEPLMDWAGWQLYGETGSLAFSGAAVNMEESPM